jgi:dihydroorotate dehydrogenase
MHSVMYRRALRPLLFLLPPDTAHELAFSALGPLEHLRWLRAAVGAVFAPSREQPAAQDPVERRADGRIGVRRMGLDFRSIVGLAGGFDKNARRPRALAALGFGHLELGTVTARPQQANPRPNLFRLPADRALINRLGFPNEGAERVAARLRAARPSLRVPVGVSIGKSRAVAVDDLDAVVIDYLAALDAVRDVADFVVVNVSSPNTTGLRTMQAREHARTLLSALRTRAAGSRLLVKIAPDLTDAQLEDVLAVVEEVRLDGVIATNTTIARSELATDPKAVEAIGAGGLSGPPLRRRSVEVVRRVRARLGRDIVVIGVGGIETADHVMALVRAGADLVQMYTGFIYEGPLSAARIGRDLGRLVEREGAASIGDFVGVAERAGAATLGAPR